MWIRFLALACVALVVAGSSRHKRRIDQLGDMIVAKMQGLHYVNFIGYGNYCGPGGDGTPVDALDACCKIHDECYEVLSLANKKKQCGNGTPRYSNYMSSYKYEQNGKVIKCLSNGNTDLGKCLDGLCKCDKNFVECMTPHRSVYNPKYLVEKWEFLRNMAKMADRFPSLKQALMVLIEKLWNEILKEQKLGNIKPAFQ